MILIVSDRADLQIYRVMVELQALGAEYGLLNVGDFPTRARLSHRLGPGEDVCELTLEGGASARAADVGAVWLRKPELPRLHPDLAEHEREYALNEARAGLRGLYDALRHVAWISPPDRVRAAGVKLTQLREAARLGLAIPRTVFTNDPGVARAFVASVDGRVVFKSIGDALLSTRAGPWEDRVIAGEVYTTVVDEAMLEIGLGRLDACPILLQEHVEKEVELRVTVVGDAVFAAELHSQERPESAVDWRRGEVAAIEHRACDLPEPVRRRCVALVRAFGLDFGAIDLVRGPDGAHVFLEINPNGQYGWVEELTGLPISRAIAERLVAHHDAARPAAA